jgi:hypothetical protein
LELSLKPTLYLKFSQKINEQLKVLLKERKNTKNKKENANCYENQLNEMQEYQIKPPHVSH